MEVSSMRVTNASTYRNYTSSVNNVHANLNKSLNKISSGKAYESAAENPLAYYQGMEIDNQYLEALSKVTLLTDVKSRLEQQEDGAYHIQTLLSQAKNEVVLKGNTATTTDTALATLRDDVLQKEHSMVNDLNSQYQDFYVYGGNDVTTPPFSLSSDGMTLTFSHKFPGESQVTNFEMNLETDPAKPGQYKFALKDPTQEDKLIQAMSEQGPMDLGYGDIRDRSTLLDTFTGGMNLLTGISSDAMISGKMSGNKITLDTIMQKLTDGPLGLTAQTVKGLNNYLEPVNSDGTQNPLSGNRDELNDVLTRLIGEMSASEHTTSTVYSDLGNKYKTLEDTETRLNKLCDSLKVQYKDTLGADPYESILEMYNNNYAYNAALQVGSQLMTSSLFDFIR